MPYTWLVGFTGDQYVGNLCCALFAYTGSTCLASDYFHHFLGSRKLSLMDGLFSRTHNFSIAVIYGLP